MIKLVQGDCLEKMHKIHDNSIDMVMCDPPYGMTACKWDTVIDIEKMWQHLFRICKKDAAMVFTASQPFTSVLICSNLKMFKYCWVWDKVRPSGFQIAKYRPMMEHEDIPVFCRGSLNYNPIMTRRTAAVTGRVSKSSDSSPLSRNDNKVRRYVEKNPFSIIRIKKDKAIHPTQKPVALMEYLIKTYTKENDFILDFAMGSGTTGVACKRLGRRFIGIEKDPDIFETAQKRIDTTIKGFA